MNNKNPEITLVFLLYNAESTVKKLLECALMQKHPDYSEVSDWLKIVFMDDFSQDRTVEKLNIYLNEYQNPSHIELIRNTPNLGLSRTINKACELVQTPYLLTCHCDSFFSGPDYIYQMLRLIKTDEKIAAITGKPIIHYDENTPLFEKINTITNLMDIFPEKGSCELIPVGFAEGRCDIFKLEALKKAGLYDTNLRTSGEDQVLNAKLRDLGYHIYIAPHVHYTMSVSTEQDSLMKIAKHQYLFAKTSPYILLSSSKSFEGIIGEKAGKNRTLRALLRLSQIFSGCAYVGILFLIFISAFLEAFILLFMVTTIKLYFFLPYLSKIPTSRREKIIFIIFQVVFDFHYTLGFLKGIFLVQSFRENEKKSASHL